MNQLTKNEKQESIEIKDQIPDPTITVKKTPEKEKQDRIIDIVKNAMSAVMGIILGVIIFILFSMTPTPYGFNWFSTIGTIILVSYAILKIVFPFFGIDTTKFGFKGWFSTEFIVVVFCFITWTFLLN